MDIHQPNHEADSNSELRRRSRLALAGIEFFSGQVTNLENLKILNKIIVESIDITFPEVINAIDEADTILYSKILVEFRKFANPQYVLDDTESSLFTGAIEIAENSIYASLIKEGKSDYVEKLESLIKEIISNCNKVYPHFIEDILARFPKYAEK